LAIIQTACTIPGRKPSIVNRIFNQKWGLMPIVINTPRGGRMMAKMIRSKLMGIRVWLLDYWHSFKISIRREKKNIIIGR
jgi:hypothetical protein